MENSKIKRDAENKPLICKRQKKLTTYYLNWNVEHKLKQKFLMTEKYIFPKNVYPEFCCKIIERGWPSLLKS